MTSHCCTLSMVTTIYITELIGLLSFGIRLPSSSIGSGKTMVEFLSAAIWERVWRYLGGGLWRR